jgi:hypothetical protein
VLEEGNGRPLMCQHTVTCQLRFRVHTVSSRLRKDYTKYYCEDDEEIYEGNRDP